MVDLTIYWETSELSRENIATWPQVEEQKLAGDEKIEVGNSLAGYCNEFKLLMVKELIKKS